MSLPSTFKLKVTSIQEAKDLDTLSLKNLVSFLKSHEIELIGNKPCEKFKSLALITNDKSAKSQTTEWVKEFSDGEFDSDSGVEEMEYLTKRF